MSMRGDPCRHTARWLGDGQQILSILANANANESLSHIPIPFSEMADSIR